jgi:hypothetical protein
MAASPKSLTQPVSNVAERLTLKLQTAWRELNECTDATSQALATVPGTPDVDMTEDERRPYITMLTIKAYVYDHRFESAMKADLLRRARHEFMVQGIVASGNGEHKD